MKKAMNARTGKKGWVTRAIDGVNALLDSTPIDLEELKGQFDVLCERIKSLEIAQNEVESDLADEAAILADQELEAPFFAAALKKKAEVVKAIKVLEASQGNSSVRSGVGNSTGSGSSVVRPIGLSLPKLSIPKFDGNKIKYGEFIDSFRASVEPHCPSDTLKMLQLKECLVGDASRALEGWDCTDTNYLLALGHLEKRFGDPEERKEALLAQLLDLEPLQEDNCEKLRALVDVTQAAVMRLEGLGVTKATFGVMFKLILIRKIPESCRRKWYRAEVKDNPSLDDLVEFLLKEVRAWEKAKALNVANSTNPGATVKAIQSQPSRPMKRETQFGSCHQKSESSSPFTTSALPAKQDWICQACKSGKHGLSKCSVYRDMSVSERRSTVKKAQVCWNCLGPHRVDACKGGGCFLCNEKHHVSLHPERQEMVSVRKENKSLGPSIQQTDSEVGKNQLQEQPFKRDWSRGSYTACVMPSSCYTKTAVVFLHSLTGEKKVKARVLIDSASDTSYIRSSVAKTLNLPVVGTGLFACVGFNERREEAREYNLVKFGMSSRFSTNEGVAVCTMWSTDKLCAPLKRRTIPCYPILSSLRLADDFGAGEIDVLIGCDLYYHVVKTDQIILSRTLRAVDTILGWVIHGKEDITAGGEDCFQKAHRPIVNSYFVQSLRDMDVLGISQDEEQNSIEYPVPRWNRIESKYEMGLIWKDNERPVSNQPQAKVRLEKIVRKMSTETKQQYDSYLKERYEKHVIDEAPMEHVRDSSSFFLPHHGIVQKDKLRIVFDGSARDGIGKSLNEYLEPGENLLPKLFDIMLRFRFGKIGVHGDIEGAFHQIIVPKNDRKYLQFLWDGRNLEFERTPFGLSCSPYMLNATIEHHLDRMEETFPEAVSFARKRRYVDDIVGSTNDTNPGQIVSQLKSLFGKAGMNLRNFRSTGTPSKTEKILGLAWNTESDQLGVELNLPGEILNKRELLRAIARVFDPLQVLAPWMLNFKVIFQNSWQEEVSWDDKLPPEISLSLGRLLSSRDIAEGGCVWFPRMCSSVLPGENGIATFHVFCDASKNAYCATVYVVGDDGKPSLLVAKSRLAPIKKPLSIPRLELVATLLGAKVMSHILKTLEINGSQVFYWTDSQDVLHWLKGDKSLKIFVKNRKKQILQLTSVNDWKYVPTEINPADLGTKGISLSKLVRSELWWGGPHFLRSPQSEWPEWSPGDQSEPSTEEEKQSEVSLISCATQQENNQMEMGLFDVHACSTLKSVVRKTAWAMRFIKVLRHKRDIKSAVIYTPGEVLVFQPLTSDEIHGALSYWIKWAQSQVFSEEIRSLEEKGSVSQQSRLKNLHPVLKDGIIHAITRSGEEPLVVLPPLSHVTFLIVEDYHRRSFHQGVSSTLTLVKSEFHIGRRTVKRVVDACRRCRRYRQLPYQSVEASLPKFRTEYSRSFSKIGIDFFGPLFVLPRVKVWVLIAVCAISRGVHLELVQHQSATPTEFALRRLFAIRGVPKEILSDNARTFKVLQEIVPPCVKWRLIPESAPWWGGNYERLVGITKKALKISLHNSCLTEEELRTCLYELSLYLNMRPLTTDADGDPLTPASFIFGVPDVKGVLSPAVQEDVSLMGSWKRTLETASRLKRRWLREYLTSLRTWRTTDKPLLRSPKIGDVVLVQENRLRSRWPIARIEKLIVGCDGQVRAAFVMLNGVLTRRPVTKLYCLEES